MKSIEELEQVLKDRTSQYNDKDNTPKINDIIYGQILILNWILDKE